MEYVVLSISLEFKVNLTPCNLNYVPYLSSSSGVFKPALTGTLFAAMTGIS